MSHSAGYDHWVSPSFFILKSLESMSRSHLVQINGETILTRDKWREYSN